MINNLSAYSFTNNDVLTLYGLASGALTTGTLDPQTQQTRDGGYLPPPVSVVYTPRPIDGEDFLVFDNYLCEGSSVSVNLSTTSTCVNLATGYDLFNFGYQLLIEEKGQVLDRVDTFNYNNTFNIVCSASLVSNWEILSGTATYNKEATALSGTGIDLLPVGTYINTDWPYDTLTVKYYLPIEESAPIFWPNELLNVYKTKKIVWDMFSIRLGGEDLKGDYIPLKIGESIYIVDQPRPIPFFCDYIITRFKFLSTNGTDLDIFASLISPEAIQYPLSAPLGFCTGSSSYNNVQFIEWSGDNTGYGLESILINVKNYRDYFNTDSEVSARLAARWYSSAAGDGNINLEITSYRGGTVTLSGFEFICTGEKISEIILPPKNIEVKSGCGSGVIDGVVYSSFISDNIGILNYNFISNTLSFTDLTGRIGGSSVDGSAGIYNIGPAPTIPSSPTYSVSAIQNSYMTKSTLLWSDGFVTENTFNYPLMVPNGIIDTSGGVIHSRKFTAPGEYTILNSTFYYNNLDGSVETIAEPYNITFVVS